ARAALLPVVHVSTYGLTWEQGTPFFRRQRSGELQRAEEELERSQYLRAIKQLTLAGFEHYEVSNFARPGWQCRHNLVYWRAEEYLAFGPGAARYVQGVRSTSCRSVVKWLRSWSGGQPCVEEEECCDPEQRAREAIMLGLRLRRGFDVADFEQRFGVQLPELAGAALEQGLRRGQLELADGRLRLTEDGLLLADSVTAEFL
ncbi:MAG: coproporphyrinogen III oxidase, partial [Planctomycetaceae bacterium]